MTIKKAIEANAQEQIVSDGGLQEYRPIVCVSVSKVYTLANRPAAASGNLSIPIWVIDAPVGEKLQFSDGTSWIPIQY
jgi:hypothetical protein